MDRNTHTNQTQQQQAASRRLPATQQRRDLVTVPADQVPMSAKIKYSSVTGVGAGLVAGVIGMHSFAGVVALGAGVAAWYGADRFHAKFGGKTAMQRKQQRPNWLNWSWWVSPRPVSGGSGEAAQPELEQEAQEPVVRPASVPASDLLRLGRLTNGARFDPPLDVLPGKGLLLAGSPGTGKSNVLGLIAQAAGAIGMPWLIIDYKGEFFPLTKIVKNGIIAGHPDQAEEVGGGFFALTAESAGELAELIMTGPFQCVLDISSYSGDGDLVAQVLSTLLRALMEYGRAVRRTGQRPWPCLIMTDEAHNFVPEARKFSSFAMKEPKESFGMLASVYASMASAGRSYGYTLIMATQRLPYIAKWSIATLQQKIVMAHAEKNDLDACEEECGALVTRDQIKSLARGSGIVIGIERKPVVVRFDKQKAPHVSNTPQVADLKRRFRNAPPQRLSRVLARRNQVQQRMPSRDRVTGPLHQQREQQATGVTRDVNFVLQGDSELANTESDARNAARKTALESAPSASVSPVESNVKQALPAEWTDEKQKALPFLYRGMQNIDKCLNALDLSTSQRNREIARRLLGK